MPSSRNYPTYCNAQLLHQWSPKNGATEAKIEVKQESAETSIPEESKPSLSKLERLQYVGGIRRIDFSPGTSKGTSIESPMGQDRLAKMSLMQKKK